jgi:hypothetical protein
MAVLVSQAKQGNLSAIRLFFAYAIGKPSDRDDSASAAAETETPGADVASAPVAGAPEMPAPAAATGQLQPASTPPPLDGTTGRPAPIPSKPKESSQEWIDRAVDAMVGPQDAAKAAQPIGRDSTVRLATPRQGWDRVAEFLDVRLVPPNRRS